MTEELKIHIDCPEAVENKLRAIGARFVKETSITDTYYDQPGMVLKVTEDEAGGLVTQLEAQDSGFRFIREEPLDDIDATKADLADRYGVKCVLRKRKRFWDYETYSINLNLFEDIGNFLIVEGETVTPNICTDTLGIEEPQYLTRSFAELKLEQMGLQKMGQSRISPNCRGKSTLTLDIRLQFPLWYRVRGLARDLEVGIPNRHRTMSAECSGSTETGFWGRTLS